MADSFNLPLRPAVSSRERERTDLLAVQIAQINSQWGSFRDVSEESLLTEIRNAGEKETEPGLPPGDHHAAELDSTERLELLYKRRAEITQFALQAHMEAMFALDFVSLLLSKYYPRQAETSISAYLKQAVPLGALSSEVVSPPSTSESTRNDIKTVSRGWRLQSFHSAAQKLLKSGARLEAEIVAETRYWDEVLIIQDKGWTLCRLPRERQALGVQFGFLEATPIFRDRGLASLRRAGDGSLILDKGVVSETSREVRVRVRQNDHITGRSQPSNRTYSEADAVESRILQARDAIFEEELFHELAREARFVASQGVTTRHNLIQFAVSDDQEILFDLVDINDTSATESIDPESKEDDTLATAIGHVVRILLTFAHRQNLHRRTQLPPPLSQKRKSVPEYHLIRPIMAYLQHKSHVRWLDSFLSDILSNLKLAGLECGFTATQFSPLTQSRSHYSASLVEALVVQLLIPQDSVFSVKLSTLGSSLDVRIRTNVSAPPFGTNYEISVNMPHYPDIESPRRIGLKGDLAATIAHLIRLDVVSAISTGQQAALAKGVAGDGQIDPAKKRLTWKATHPHHGELLRVSDGDEQSKKLKVTLLRDSLTAQAYALQAFNTLRRPDRAHDSEIIASYSWNSTDQARPQAEHKTLLEFVAEVAR